MLSADEKAPTQPPLEKAWENLPVEKKKKLIEKINESSDYQWEPLVWPKVHFKFIPLLLKKALEKEIKKAKPKGIERR